MMRSMYSGVAGLKTHQTRMDVIGNNIANVNTVAYKSQSMTFSELMYQTTQAASGANAETGTAGINARQIGLGVKTGAINTAISTQGASQTTNNPFDIRVTGSSFFIVSNGTNTYFTRDGSFYVDGQGNLAMTSNGYNVMGWQVDPETMDIKQETVSALRIMSAENMTYPPEATSRASVSGILDKNDTNVTASSGKTMNLMFYDNLGYNYTAKIVIKSTDIEGEYAVQLDSILDMNNEKIETGDVAFGAGSTFDKKTTAGLNQADYTVSPDGLTFTNLKDPLDTITIDPNAAITDDQWTFLAKAYGFEDVEEFKSLTFNVVNPADPTYTGTATMEEVLRNQTVTLTNDLGQTDNTLNAQDLIQNFDIKGMTADKITLTGSTTLLFDTTTGIFQGIGGPGLNTATLQLSTLDPAGRFADLVIDFKNSTMYNNSGTSTIGATAGDEKKLGMGRRLGEMSGVSIQNDGRIYATYSNGMSRLLGQIAVAEFANASGLEKDGDNLYKASQNSGEFDGIGVDVTSTGGYLTTGVLEMSNVDLSAEFTDMITTQRGFQANSRIITVSDTLLEELVNLKR